MSLPKIALSLVLVFTLLGDARKTQAQSKSQHLQVSAPSTARINTDVTITATLSDAWTSNRLGSRMVAFAVGEENYLSSKGSYPTNSSGVVSIRTRFTKTGRHRIVVFVDNGSGYLSQRTTTFITIIR